MTASGAPTTVMKGSAAIRLEYFRSFTMAHPLLKEVDLALREAIQEPAGASLIFVYGPTGVGKTTLRTPVENQLKESLIPLLQQDPGRASVVSIEAAAPDSAQFSWKDYYKRALMALEEPLIGKKIKYSIRGLDRDISGRLIVDGRTVGLELRHAVENTLAHRRPAAFFVDEAQHLTKVRGGRKLHDQLDSIKSLASLTGTAHVLIGTYELLPFRNLSAQLSRRSIDVHFRRYRAENQEDYSSFRSVLFTFQRHLPLSGDSELLKHVDFCYERSVGCVGVLKNWLIRALSVALLNNSPSITTQILERTAWSVEQSERMAREALEGEASLATTDESRNRLRRLLSLNLAMPSAVSPSNRNPPIANRRPGWEDANQCVIVSGFPRECAMQLDQQEKEFESWDLSEPAVPPRSKCFHLQPMGFGTGYVECLTSYFSRLAVEHSVSAGALTHRIMIPRNAGKRNMFSCAVSCRVSRLRCPTSGINSLGSMAARFASVVEELTGRSDLHYLTMLTWRELLPPQLLTRGMGAWCPHCINEWRETGRSVYIPLLWTLEIVKHCPLHQSPLQLMCPHCKAPQPFIAQLSPNGFCARCKRWLGKAVRESGLDQFSVLRPESSDWEIWVAREMAGTIERSFGSPVRLKKDTLSEIIRTGVAAEGFSDFARLLGVSTAPIQSWRLGKSSPMLPVYVRLARVFRLPLSDLLTNRVMSRLVVDTSDVLYWRAIRITTPVVFDPVKAKYRIEEALRASPPPSFGVFRTRHRYHDSTLKKHFPKLCDRLVKRNHDYRTAVSAKRLADRLSEFRSIAYRFHEQGRDPVLNHIMKQLSVRKGLEHKVARDFLTKIKIEIKAREAKRKASTLIARL